MLSTSTILAIGSWALLASANQPRNPDDTDNGYNTSSTASNTTTGLQYAQSCASALSAYSSSSMSWQTAHQTDTISTQEYSDYSWIASGPSIIIATSLTTLCDGHPRVVGKAQTKPAGTTTFKIPGATDIITENLQGTPYPYPSPTCSINPSDCASLYTEQLKSTGNPQIGLVCTLPQPSYSLGPTGQKCDNCYIRGKAAQLLYWPVRTKEGSGNLCGNGTAEIIPATPTGNGPNTAVIGSLTITSPTVAISFEGLVRIDGCGPTVSNTIVTVPPDQVTSVRGARAAFDLQSFAFQDLNYRCQPANSSTYTIQDVPGDDCYQEVPATAYFGGNHEWATIGGWPSAVRAQLTIGDNYAPQILPPAAMSDYVESVWGKGCGIFPDGVWDPPLALQQQTSIEGVTRPNMPETTTGGTPVSTSATPAELSVTFPSATELPSMPTTVSVTAAPILTLGTDTMTYTDVDSGSKGILINDQSSIIVTTVITVNSHVVSPGTAGSIYVDETPVDPPPGSTTINMGTDEFSLTSVSSQTYVVAVNGTSSTMDPGGNAATLGSITVSAASNGLVMNTAESQTTTSMTHSSSDPGHGHHTTSSNGMKLDLPPVLLLLSSIITWFF